MLKKFTLKNYKNFKDEISIDFNNTANYQFSTDCITNGLISKMLIYGRNATGKTNLGKAIMDICNIMRGRVLYMENSVLINADSKEHSATFSYEFQFDDQILQYQYNRLSNQELSYETLMIDGIVIYSCDFEEKLFNFTNLNYIYAETANVGRYEESIVRENEMKEMQQPRLTFLRWLINNIAFEEQSILLKLENYIRRMALITVGDGRTIGLRRERSIFLNRLLEDEEQLKGLEDFLNAMGIECKLVLKELPDGQRELYFHHDRLVPFYETASSGTLALVDLYRKLIPRGVIPSFLYVDEFDAFYHYEMAENVLQFFKKKYPECQMIITSHNTNLMTNRLMRPDCAFILFREGTLTSHRHATKRELREGHNLEKMYISGEFAEYE